MNATTLSRFSLGCALWIAPGAFVTAAETDRGWSVEADVLDVESMGTVSGFTFQGEESGLSLGLGYAFNRHLAVEANYHQWGEHFATDCPVPLNCIVQNADGIDVSGLSVLVVGVWPITGKLEVYGKLGAMGWDADFKQFPSDDTGRDAVYGIGIGAWLSPSWRLKLGYEKVDDLDLRYAGLGLTYRF